MQPPSAPAAPLKPIPHALLGYQQRWCADRTPVKVIEKSRRVGLSWAEACDSVLLAARASGMDVWYIGYNKDMAQEFIRDCGDWAKQFDMAVSEIEQTEEIFKDGDDEKAILAYVIRFASGFRITALSSRPSNLRGKQGRVIIDEAAFHDDLAELLKAALALLIWGGEVHIISTHNGAENPFNELINEIRAGKRPYKLFTVTLDDALGEGLFKRICLVRGKDWSAEAEAAWRAELVKTYGSGADEELFCIPSRGSGMWLPRVLIEARMSAELRVVRYRAPDGADLWPEDLLHAEVDAFCERELAPELAKLDPTLRSGFGWDFGRYADLSCFAPHQVMPDLTRRFPFLLELSNVPFKAQERILFFCGDRLPRLSCGMLDAGGNGSYLAEVARQRYGEDLIVPVVFSEPWYRDNTAPLKAAFEDNGILLPRDAATTDDLASFRIVRGVPRIPELRVKDAHGQKRHGDAGIAILLSYAASRADYSPVEFMSVGVTRAGYELADYLGNDR